MERNNKSFGVSQFRVKYKETALHAGPSGISAYLGTLHKGAVVEVVADTHPYYYKVQLDNGLEGYIYKPAGELTTGLSVTRLAKPTEEVKLESSPVLPSTNGTYVESAVTPDKKPERLTRVRSVSTSRPSTPPASRNSAASYSAGSNGASPNGRVSQAVIITSGEIAVFNKPGIVGQQVGKLKRGERATLVDQDSFFFKVALSNGQVGYIPRYAAELI